MATSVPPTPTVTIGPPLPAACAADVRGTAFAVGSLDDRLVALRTWARGNARDEASLMLTDTVLTDAVRASVGRSGAPPVQDAAVIIRSDGLRLSATASVAFLRFPIRATLVPQLSAGRLTFAVRDLETGGLPGPFRQQVSDLIAQAADAASWQLPLEVSAAVLRSGCGVVRGTAAP